MNDSNHGKEYHQVSIISINTENQEATVKWDSTRKNDVVDIVDLRKLEDGNVMEPCKRKSPDFYSKEVVDH